MGSSGRHAIHWKSNHATAPGYESGELHVVTSNTRRIFAMHDITTNKLSGTQVLSYYRPPPKGLTLLLAYASPEVLQITTAITAK